MRPYLWYFSSVCICHVKGLVRAVWKCMTEKLLLVRLTSMKEHWTFLPLTSLASSLASTVLMSAKPFLHLVYCYIHRSHLLFFLRSFQGLQRLSLSRAQGIFQAGTTRGQSRIRNIRAHPGSVLQPGVWWGFRTSCARSQFTHYLSGLQPIAITSQNPLSPGRPQHLRDMKLKTWQHN